MVQPEPDQKPKLEVSPIFLDFGLFDPALPLTEQPIIQLEVTNRGGGMLIGRVIPQYSWLIVSPVEFRCPAGQTSPHLIQLSTGAPPGQIQKDFAYNSLVIVNANAGAVSLGGSYRVTRSHEKNSLLPAGGWFLVGLLVLLVFFFFLFREAIPGLIPASQANGEVSALYTQGAATVMAQMTITASTSSVTTITPEPPLFVSTRPFETPTPVLTLTNTPWPRDKYFPEVFISEYFSTINGQDYKRAWGLLSKKFQEGCCNIGGNDPFVVYSSFWKDMDKVEIISAKLQAWDKNPAQVLVKLRYRYKSGKVADSVQMFSLISDAERSTLLVDEVK